MFYIIHSSHPTVAYSLKDAMEDLNLLKQAFVDQFPQEDKDYKGFEIVANCEEYIIKLYKYQRSLVAANRARMSHFNFSGTYKKPLLVPSPSLHVKVIHAVVPQDVLQDCWVSALEKFRSITLPLLTESGSAEEKVSKFTDGFQELKRMKYDVDADEVFTGKEVSKNTRLCRRIAQALKSFGATGYTVVDSKKIVAGTETLQYSRFFSSMVEICIFHETFHHGGIILEMPKSVPESTLVGVATENKQNSVKEPLAQLYAGMEKLAAELAFSHLQRCPDKIFRYIHIFGMTIDYENDTAAGYLLVMDFEKHISTMFEDSAPPSTVEDGSSKLISTLVEISNNTLKLGPLSIKSSRKEIKVIGPYFEDTEQV